MVEAKRFFFKDSDGMAMQLVIQAATTMAIKVLINGTPIKEITYLVDYSIGAAIIKGINLNRSNAEHGGSLWIDQHNDNWDSISKRIHLNTYQ